MPADLLTQDRECLANGFPLHLARDKLYAPYDLLHAARRANLFAGTKR